LPLIADADRAHHGKILAQAASLADRDKLKPLLSDQRFSISTIDAAFARVTAGSLGKVVVDIMS
jgi:hypothetical protein